MQRRRRHHQADRDDHQHDRGEVQELLACGELLAEALVEYRDQLEAEERLDARQHHAAFLENERGRLVERDLLFPAASRGLRHGHRVK